MMNDAERELRESLLRAEKRAEMISTLIVLAIALIALTVCAAAMALMCGGAGLLSCTG